MGITWGFSPSEEQRWIEMWDTLGDVGGLGNREAEIVADVARRDMAAHFERERSPEGHPWVPLAPLTRQERKAGIDARGVPFRTGEAHPILKRTGDLKLSFTDPRHPRNVTDLFISGGVTYIELGAEDDPATPGRIETLHEGGTVMSIMAVGAAPTAHEVPARPWIGLSDSGLTQLGEQTERVLAQRLERIK